jgi:hypothetical protein
MKALEDLLIDRVKAERPPPARNPHLCEELELAVAFRKEFGLSPSVSMIAARRVRPLIAEAAPKLVAVLDVAEKHPEQAEERTDGNSKQSR